MHSLRIILVRTKFPENIGMVARACANMGAGELSLVNPYMWNYQKALPLATPKGIHFLDEIVIYSSLSDALSGTLLSFGTTARLGGWRRDLLFPDQAAEIIEQTRQHGKVAIVFGSEDKGLENSEIDQCSRIINIPTDGASSLNLAQSVLICLYECLKIRNKNKPIKGDVGAGSRLITYDEQELLFETLKKLLVDINYLNSNNPEYFFMPLRRFFAKRPLHRHEMDMLMGICRQIELFRSGKIG